RYDGGEDDDQSAHRGRAPLGVMARGPFRSDDLADAVVAQLPDDAGTDDEGDEQRRHGRAGRPERDVIEQIENDVLTSERREQMIQHQEMWIRTRSKATPRETFNSTHLMPATPD